MLYFVISSLKNALKINISTTISDLPQKMDDHKLFFTFDIFSYYTLFYSSDHSYCGTGIILKTD